MRSWHSVTRTPSPTELRRISRRAAAVAPSATLAVDAKAKALQAAGEHRHRFRGRRAGLPHTRPHRGGGRGGVPRTGQPPLHPDRRDPRPARGDRRQDPAGLGLHRQAVTGAGDQRRQAGRGQRLRRPVRPRRRGHRPGPVLDDLPRIHRPGRGHARRRVLRRDDRIPIVGRRPRGGVDPQHEGAPLRLALQPDRRRLPTPRDRGDRPLGPRAGDLGADRRDLRTPGLRRGGAPLHARAWSPNWPTVAWWPTGWPRPTP